MEQSDDELDIVTIPVQEAAITLRVHAGRLQWNTRRLIQTAERFARRWGKRQGLVVGGIRVDRGYSPFETPYFTIRWFGAKAPEGIDLFRLSRTLDGVPPGGESVKWRQSGGIACV